MALYDYKCDKCGIFELAQSINDKPLSECPRCGGKIKRLISSSGIVFKGSGFYSTDHRQDKPKEAAKPEAAKPETAKPAEKKPKA